MLRKTTSFCLGALLLICGIGHAVVNAQDSAVAEKKKSTKKASTKAIVPIFEFNSAVLESPGPDDPFFGTPGAEPLKDIVARLKKAGEDDGVKAIVVHLGTAGIGSAQIEELHKAFRALRDQGKPVYVFSDSLSFRNLALMSAASRISVSPVGDLFINGLYGEQPHLRGLLDKLHVTPDYLTCGAYKSAGELFMRSKPSPEAEEMYNWLFDSLFDTYLKMIAEGRGQSVETVKGWVDHGLYSAEKATELGIIDAVEYRQDMLNYIKQEHGEKVKLSKKYGKSKKDSIDFGNPFWAFKIWAEALAGTDDSDGGEDSVAIVYVEGPIVPGSPQPSPFGGSQGIAYSDPIRRALDKAAEDDSVKAVVLRVNSPGGSAVASEVILQATRRVAAEKPLVVSMGDVAGSGGYYVSCGADTIFADAATITASIGVVAGKLATHEMWDSVGINWHPIARGENAGMIASGEVFTDTQKETMQSWMDEVYEVFKGHVVAKRGERLKKPIDQLAGGRVFTGQQALDLGLVDRIGTLDDAVAFAAEQADVSDYRIRVIPRAKNLVEMMFSDLAGASKDKDDDKLGLASRQLWQTRPVWDAALPLVKTLEPHRAAAMQRVLWQLEILQRESISLMMPEFVFE